MLEINQVVGSAEGGDQGVLNNGFCPQWNSVGEGDAHCGRLPWMFNVQAAHYENYKTLRKMSGLREPTLIHFVSDGKPWRVLAMDYQNIPFSQENIAKLAGQREAHLLWRAAFFKGTREDVSHLRRIRCYFLILTRVLNHCVLNPMVNSILTLM